MVYLWLQISQVWGLPAYRAVFPSVHLPPSQGQQLFLDYITEELPFKPPALLSSTLPLICHTTTAGMSDCVVTAAKREVTNTTSVVPVTGIHSFVCLQLDKNDTVYIPHYNLLDLSLSSHRTSQADPQSEMWDGQADRRMHSPHFDYNFDRW